MLRRSFMGMLALLGASPAGAADTDSAALWRRLREGGHVVLMRHAATVPGVGDPQNFKLGVCATQRNLSDGGREDARRIGAAFRERDVPVSEVLSSRWCRCVDTARSNPSACCRCPNKQLSKKAATAFRRWRLRG